MKSKAKSEKPPTLPSKECLSRFYIKDVDIRCSSTVVIIAVHEILLILTSHIFEANLLLTIIISCAYI